MSSVQNSDQVSRSPRLKAAAASRTALTFSSDIARAVSRGDCCFLFEETPAVKGAIALRRSVLPCCSQLVDELSSFLFRRSRRRSFLGAASAAQFHAGPSGGQKAAGARRGSDPAAVGAGGLKGSSRLSMCQAAIKSLRATDDFAGFLPCRALTRREWPCHGLAGLQAWFAASTAAQRRVREPALERAPVAERSPDWLTLGASPA